MRRRVRLGLLPIRVAQPPQLGFQLRHAPRSSGLTQSLVCRRPFPRVVDAQQAVEEVLIFALPRVLWLSCRLGSPAVEYSSVASWADSVDGALFIPSCPEISQDALFFPLALQLDPIKICNSGRIWSFRSSTQIST